VWRLLLVGSSLLEVFACGVPQTSGDVHSVADATSQDAGGTTCEQYCMCTAQNCPDQLPEAGASCMDFCATLRAEQRDCRVYHCELAAMSAANAARHCPYTVGAGDGGLCM